MRFRGLAFLTVLLPALLAAQEIAPGWRGVLGGERATPGSPLPAVGPPAVGVLLPLSGQHQAFGEACLRGVRLAAGAVDDRPPPVRLAVLDTRGEAGGAAEGYRRLAADPGIVAVLGPMLSWEAAAVRDETAVARLPALSFSQRAFPPGPPLYRFGMSKEDQAYALADYAVRERGLLRWAVLHPEDAFGQDVSLLFRDRVESLGGRVVAMVGYDSRKTDFQTDVERLRSRVGIWHGEGENRELELLVDGVFLPDTAERIALLAPHLAFFDIRGVQLLGTNGWNDGEQLLKGRPYVDGAVFVAGFFLYSFRPEVRIFVDAYRDAFGSDPGILEAYGFDAARLLLTEIQAGAVDREALIEHMRRPRTIAGATGLTLRHGDGTFGKPLFLLTVRDGTLREVERAGEPGESGIAAPPDAGPAIGSGARPVWRRPEWDSRERPGGGGVPILRPGETR